MFTPYYRVFPREPGHFRIKEKTSVGCDLFVGEHSALLLDTGYGCGKLRQVVDSLRGDLPLTVVNTHGHPDHAGGNYQFAGCPIYLAPEDLGIYSSYTNEAERRRSYQAMAADCDPAELDGEDAYSCAAPPATLPLTEEQIFDIGGRRLRVVAFPGHTAGSIGLLDESTDLLYTGDAMNAATWMFLPESLHISVYAASIRKAIAMGCPGFYVSHGDALLDPHHLERYLYIAEHMKWSDGVPTPMDDSLSHGAEVRKLILPEEGDYPACCVVISEEKMR